MCITQDSSYCLQTHKHFQNLFNDSFSIDKTEILIMCFKLAILWDGKGLIYYCSGLKRVGDRCYAVYPK